MKKDKSLFILFSNRSYSKDECHLDTILSNYGVDDSKFNDVNKFICAINFKMVYGYEDIKYQEVIEPFNDDIDAVIIKDSDLSRIVKSKLESIILTCQKIFCIYHKSTVETNSETYKKQRESLESMCGEKKVYEINQSHVRGSIYCDEFKEILKWRFEKNEVKYLETLEQLKQRFPDPILEVKLNILDSYLVPDIALRTILPMELIERQNDQETISENPINVLLPAELISYQDVFSQFLTKVRKLNNLHEDPLKEGYIPLLRDLRDSLLDN
jgi:hypothetical protein